VHQKSLAYWPIPGLSLCRWRHVHDLEQRIRTNKTVFHSGRAIKTGRRGLLRKQAGAAGGCLYEGDY